MPPMHVTGVRPHLVPDYVFNTNTKNRYCKNYLSISLWQKLWYNIYLVSYERAECVYVKILKILNIIKRV